METAAAETEARAPEYDVFISHSSHDKAVADAMVAALEGRGIRCWIAPRDILPGREWADAILAGIHACRVMVLVLSAQANQSSQVPREVERAVHRHMAIVPFRIENVEPSGSLEYFLSTPHWLDAITPPLEPHLVRLAETVRRLLGAADTTVDGSGTASAGTGGVAIGETPTGGGGRRVERWVRPVGVRRVGRVTLVSLAFIAAIAAQYALANFPVAVDVEKYNPMVAREGEELVIQGPKIPDLLLSHDGTGNELVDAYFTQAQLAPEMLTKLKKFRILLNAPAGPSEVDYVIDDLPKKDVEVGRTNIEVHLHGAASPSTELHLYSLGNDRSSALVEMKAVDAELEVRLDTAFESASDTGSVTIPCPRKLKVDGKSVSTKPDGTYGEPVTVIVASGSTFRFRFNPYKDSLWGSDGLFQPFTLGPPLEKPDTPPLEAVAVGVRPQGEDSGSTPTPYHLRVQPAPGEHTLFRLDTLKVGADRLQVNVTGQGRREVDGKLQTVDLLTRLKKNPLLSTLLLALDSALITWFVRVVFHRQYRPGGA